MKKKYIYILLLILGVSILHAQETPGNDSITKPRIEVIARPQQNKISLRWAVNNPLAWKWLSQYGYKLERYTITRDGKTLPKPEITELTDFPIVPDPLESWEALIQVNDNAAIIAQALYGEEFQVSGGDELQAIIEVSQDLQQRFTFGLFAADQDFEVAKKAGLGYDDLSAKPNEKYLYRIISNVPSEKMEIEYGGVFVGIVDYQPLPEPVDFVAVFKDNNAILSWNYQILNAIYSSYYIERSTDGINFTRLNEQPYTTLNEKAQNQRQGRIFYVDSITNNKNYSYKIQGISPFGELGPYSNVVSGEGKPILEYVPHLISKEFLNDNSVKLVWEFPEEGETDIKGFELNKTNGKGETLQIVLKEIPSNSRSVNYDKLEPSNYFTITAKGKQGSDRTSFPMLVQPVDSIPPAKPMGLNGSIDSLGVVSLFWDKNVESDLFGYRIYRGNKENEEFSQLTVNPLEDIKYTDSVKIKSLNDKVYYKIIAVDHRYNMSEASDILVIKKPDVIPPTSPVFKKYEVKDGKINLEWVQSSSDDVASYLLYRKENNNEQWQLIFETAIDTIFTDTEVAEGNIYNYTILAKDDSGLESLPSPSVSVVVPKSTLMPQVKGLYAQADKVNRSIKLSWRYKEENVAEFEIYKAKEGEPLRLMRIAPADTNFLTDFDIIINTKYKYALRAVFKDGKISKMDEINVTY